MLSDLSVPSSVEEYEANLARELSRPVIYFVSAKVPDFPVKIGLSAHGKLSARLTALQIGLPYQLELLVVCLGDAATESEMHERFGQSHLRGEWFIRSPDLMAYIAELQTAHPDWDLEFLEGRRWEAVVRAREKRAATQNAGRRRRAVPA